MDSRGSGGGSLIVSVAILVVVWLILRSARRAERAGEVRLEMLREQQVRLLFLREERRMLEELEWRRAMMDREQRVLELEAPLQSAKPLHSNGHSEAERTGSRSWWQRIIGAVSSSAP